MARERVPPRTFAARTPSSWVGRASCEATDRALALLGDAIPHVVWGAGPDGTIDYLNAQGIAYAGRPADGTWALLSLVHPADVEGVAETWADAQRAHALFALPVRLRRHDGVHRWHAVRAQPVVDEGGAVVRWVGTSTDIEGAMQQEADLRDAHRQADDALSVLDSVLAQAPLGFGFVDRDLRMVSVNQMLATIGGGGGPASGSAAAGRPMAEVVAPMWTGMEPHLRRVLATGEPAMDIEVEGRAAVDPGPPSFWLVGCFPVSRAGEVIGVGIVVADHSARRQAEADVRFQAAMLAAIGQAVVVVDGDRRIRYWNRAAEELHGWSAAEAIGRRSTDLIPRDEPPDAAADMVARLRAGETWTGDVRIRRRDGSPVWVHVTNTPVLGDDGRLVSVIGTSVDISDRIASEAERRHLAAIVAGSGEAIFGATLDGVFTSWNPAAETLFGFTAEEVIGGPVSVIAPDDRVEEQAAMRAQVRAGEPPTQLETTRRRKDGTLVEVVLTISPTVDDTGHVIGLSAIGTDITERVAARRALEVSERRLAEAQRIAHIGSFEVDLATGAITWSAEYRRIVGVADDAVPTLRLATSLIHPDDLEAVAEVWRAATHQGTPFDLLSRVVRPDGSERHVRSRAVSAVADDGSVTTVTGTMTDETDREAADRVRREAESHFEISFEQSATGAVLASLDGLPTRVNRAACALLGRPATQLIGRRWTEYSHPDDVPLGQAAGLRIGRGHDTHADERRYLRPDGSTVWAAAQVTLVRDDEGTPHHYFTQIQDITDRKRMEEQLSHQALHDSLTGLPNRALLDDRLVHALAGARRRRAQLAVAFFDIDDFKLVNDSLGHAAGDEVLCAVADRIAGAIRPDDTVARFGGDEFVVVYADMTGRDPAQVTATVAAAVAGPLLVQGQELNLSVSVGIALAEGSATPHTLLRDSDAAMYRAKSRGRAHIQLFDETARAEGERRLVLVSALHRALERDELSVHYQPVVHLTTGTLVSAEALLRWEHPLLGAISPAEFIPLAEETGLILELGAWVLDQACAQLVCWQRSQPDMAVAVNLSARQMLAPDVVAVVAEVLDRRGVDGHRLCLELTESVLMDDAAYFETVLGGLKELGVQLAIDDFGTGYSSLGYIQRYPIDAVKIDRSFVDRLGTDTHDSALVAAIVAMASALDLEVIAEGIETEDQLVRLRELGCHRAQGFFLARPMPAAAMARVVREGTSWPVP